MTQTDPFILQVCAHEVGHAVVLISMVEITPVLVWADALRGGRCWGGRVNNTLQDAIYSAAGEVGEAVLSDLCWNDRSLRRQLIELATKAKPIAEVATPQIDEETLQGSMAAMVVHQAQATSEISPEQFDIAGVLRAETALHIRNDNFFNWCARRAKKIIQSQMPMFAALMVELLEHGIVYKDRIDELKRQFWNVDAPSVHANTGAF